MSIGSKLKALRILKGLTQEELADRAELSKGFISQLERDLTSPSIATLMDILQCLGTTIGEFFAETADEQIVFGKQDFFTKTDAELKIPSSGSSPTLRKTAWSRFFSPWSRAVPPAPTRLTREKNWVIF